jgi:RecG-like helicase
MNADANTFKRIVQDLLDKHSAKDSISDTLIDEQVEKTFAAKDVLGLAISDEDKLEVRNELLADNKIRLEPGVAIVPRTHKKWFADRKQELDLAYWSRFKQLLVKDKGFPVNVVAEMDKVSDEIVDLLGDPTRTEEREQRRGLIIGDVQSGKTVNYSGIICKAVDARYRVVILMTGTTNDLRKQTQMRLDESFTGIDTGSETLNFIGVGQYNKRLRPISFTTVDKDFSKSAAKQLSSALSQSDGDRPMLFVIKKNVSVLKSLLEWIMAQY